MQASGTWHRMFLVNTDISDEIIASVIIMKVSELGTSLAIAST
jgi:hypothetical protein